MRKILFLLFMTLLLGSCKVKEKIVEVPIPQIKTEIKYIDKVKYDSIYLKDSVYIIQKGDTIYNKYKSSIDTKYTCDDVYVAINAQYHDYSTLFHKWFNDIDDKIIKSAMVFWFMDEDYTGNKVKDYFKL